MKNDLSKKQSGRAAFAFCSLGALCLLARVGAQPVSNDNQSVKPANNSSMTAPITATGAGQVEIVFILDTTGSMAGLIEGAKQKIWSIVNEIASAKPAPIVKIGFVAYRDKGDAYVTQVHDLSDDLDGAFATLSTLSAAGGGDAPEHVSQGMHDGVQKISWSKALSGGGIYQVIFLVGDCPPHTDYDDGFDYKKHASEAIARGITVNAIRCGSQPGTEPVWQEIARLGEGRYFSIAQSGGVLAIATPFDKDIGLIADKIETTTVARGGKGSIAYKRQGASVAANDDLEVVFGKYEPAGAAGAKADRAEFNAKSGQVYGGWDIVTQAMNGQVKIEELKDEELPEELKKLTPAERVKFIQAKIEERRAAQKQLMELQQKRQKFISDYMAKNKLNDKNSFDVLVKQTVREQAAKRNIKFQ